MATFTPFEYDMMHGSPTQSAGGSSTYRTPERGKTGSSAEHQKQHNPAQSSRSTISMEQAVSQPMSSSHGGTDLPTSIELHSMQQRWAGISDAMRGAKAPFMSRLDHHDAGDPCYRPCSNRCRASHAAGRQHSTDRGSRAEPDDVRLDCDAFACICHVNGTDWLQSGGSHHCMPSNPCGCSFS